MKIIIVIFLFAYCQWSNAAIIAGPITNASNGHRYLLLAADTWTGSEAEAIRLGGHLATVRNAEENDFITSNFLNFAGVPRDLWIGLNDAREEGTFVWSSGEAWTFSPDGSVVPSGNAPDLEDDVHIIQPGHFPAGGLWNDFPNEAHPSRPCYGVVEIGAVRLSIEVSEVRLCWNTESNKVYQVQFRSELTTNVWTDLGNPIPGNGSTNCVTDAVVGSRRFYRVVTPP